MTDNYSQPSFASGVYLHKALSVNIVKFLLHQYIRTNQNHALSSLIKQISKLYVFDLTMIVIA